MDQRATVAEVVKTFNAAQVACSAVMSSKDMVADPQYQTRDMHIQWEDGQAGKVKGIGIAPRYSCTPGKIWRGAVGLGFDNRRIYSELLCERARLNYERGRFSYAIRTCSVTAKAK
jgi:crotonobetainyl-CoA:carnitine CoA-transferase CaiB-like acyl-CoA transferase